MPKTPQTPVLDAGTARLARNKRLALGIIDRKTETEEVYEAANETTQRPRGETSQQIHGATVTHQTDEMVSMYDKEGRHRVVTSGSVRVLMTEGLYLQCPLCQGEHESGGPNDCPAQEPVKFRVCPVCGKTIHDDRVIVESYESEDPNMIPTELPNTPEARTMAKLQEHMIAYHRTHARQMGLVKDEAAMAGR